MDLFIIALIGFFGYALGFAIGVGLFYGGLVLYWHVSERLDSRR